VWTHTILYLWACKRREEHNIYDSGEFDKIKKTYQEQNMRRNLKLPADLSPSETPLWLQLADVKMCTVRGIYFASNYVILTLSQS
jgi:hypothetical protein